MTSASILTSPETVSPVEDAAGLVSATEPGAQEEPSKCLLKE